MLVSCACHLVGDDGVAQFCEQRAVRLVGFDDERAKSSEDDESD